VIYDRLCSSNRYAAAAMNVRRYSQPPKFLGHPSESDGAGEMPGRLKVLCSRRAATHP
jgi:hypothetical protein